MKDKHNKYIFKIGDYVKIINKGLNQPTSTSLAKELGATKYHCKYISSIYEDIFGTIVNIKEKDDYGRTTVLIDIGEDEILISVEGIELIKEGKKKISNKELFGV